jgi:hypothetical protein
MHASQQQQQQQQEGPFAGMDLERRLSSFALDHISPTTTATTLASFAQHQDELEGLTGSSGVDVGVGPVS